MRYVMARLEDYERDHAYRIYVTKSLQLIPQSRHLTVSYSDVLIPSKVDTRSGDDIAIDVMSRAGLRFKE